MFRSSGAVSWASRQYQFVLTNKRIMLLGPLGSETDGTVVVRLKKLRHIVFKESGKTGEDSELHIGTKKSRLELRGPAYEVKRAYRQVMKFM